MCEPAVQRGNGFPSADTSRSCAMPSATGSTRSTTTVRVFACVDGSPMRTGDSASRNSGFLRSGFSIGSHSTHKCSGPRNDVFGT